MSRASMIARMESAKAKPSEPSANGKKEKHEGHDHTLKAELMNMAGVVSRNADLLPAVGCGCGGGCPICITTAITTGAAALGPTAVRLYKRLVRREPSKVQKPARMTVQ